MEDFEIVELYWARNENAIVQTDRKYGRYCRRIALDILADREDAEECINDTWLRTWNSIPPQRPEKLAAYVGKICRNTAIHLYEKLTAVRRGGSQTDSCLDELAEIVGHAPEAEDQLHLSELTDAINRFLRPLDAETRKIFVRRYWYMSSVKEIAKEYRLGESKVKVSLMRTREKLKIFLREEGFDL